MNTLLGGHLKLAQWSQVNEEKLRELGRELMKSSEDLGKMQILN